MDSYWSPTADFRFLTSDGALMSFLFALEGTKCCSLPRRGCTGCDERIRKGGKRNSLQLIFGRYHLRGCEKAEDCAAVALAADGDSGLVLVEDAFRYP